MTTVKCPQCATVNSTDNEFCDNCGAQLPVQAGLAAGLGTGGALGVASPVHPPLTVNAASSSGGLVCPQCQAPLTPGDEFCFNCGHDVRILTSVGGGSPAAIPAAPAVPPTVAPPPATGMKDDDLERELALLNGSAPDPVPATPLLVATATPATTSADPDPDPVAPPAASVGNNGSPAVPNAFGVPVAEPAANAFAAVPATLPPVVATTVGSTTLKLHVAGPYGDEMVEWKGQEILLGRRDPKTRVFPNVNLDDSAASRRHLAVWLEASESKFYAQDLESANGTSLNGHDLRPGEPTEIHNNDVLKIGTRYSIQVRIG